MDESPVHEREEEEEEEEEDGIVRKYKWSLF
jgi:hypothetical protein